ncbi:MAG: recombinase family protein, partial [Chloroflexi bacterium]|nr:recombinase family protein [Chloroflexota bacterium]
MRVVGLIRRGVEAPGGPGTPGKLRFQLEQYCRDRSHELLSVIGLDDPPESSRPEGGLYGAVLAALRAVPSPELVLIPGSRHLADSVETFVERVLEVERLGVTVRNTASPLLDPVEIAVRELPRGGSATGRDRRIREAIASKAARGEVLGRTPYGYRKGLDGLPEPYPAEAAIVRDIFDLYAGVNPGQSGPGLRRLAAELGRRGARTRSGRAWTPVSLAGLLTNRAYTGEYVRGAQRITQNHPAIIDGAVFRRAQELLSGRRPVRRPRTKPEYLLSGLIRCQACDRLLRGVAKERRWRRSDGGTSARVYRYYACPERSGADGPHSTVRADGLERAVLDDLKMKLA